MVVGEPVVKTVRTFVLAVLALAACSTPSVPLPPPDVDTTALTFSSPNPGEVVLMGAARTLHANAKFFVIDHQTGDGVIATAAADGTFATPALTATVGDVAEIYFVTPDNIKSISTCVTVLVEQPLVGADCP
jgi:hypothetical protein